MFQHAVKIGVPMAMGTDAGVEPHGLNAREFSLMTKNGLSAAGADGGTAKGADLLGLADQTGRWRPVNLRISWPSPAIQSWTSKRHNTPYSS